LIKGSEGSNGLISSKGSFSAMSPAMDVAYADIFFATKTQRFKKLLPKKLIREFVVNPTKHNQSPPLGDLGGYQITAQPPSP
jgi:hypothetical protein